MNAPTVHKIEFDGRGIAKSLCGAVSDEKVPLSPNHVFGTYKKLVTCKVCIKKLESIRDAIDFQLGVSEESQKETVQ